MRGGMRSVEASSRGASEPLLTGYGKSKGVPCRQLPTMFGDWKQLEVCYEVCAVQVGFGFVGGEMVYLPCRASTVTLLS